jgi:hypothetical protein
MGQPLPIGTRLTCKGSRILRTNPRYGIGDGGRCWIRFTSAQCGAIAMGTASPNLVPILPRLPQPEPSGIRFKWRRISDTHYNIDAERCAIQFTADDLAEWRPLDKQDSVETDDTQSWPDDPRTFATLLLSGQLRFCIECSVPIDDAMIAEALPEDSGLPMPRQVWIPAQKNFIKTVSYADGLSAPSGLAVANLDMLADAQQQADLTRDSAQDTAVHASISTAGDWERQKIGSQITSIDGRAIDLGKGAQIVAVRLDTRSYNYEYLTESLALALKDRDRKLLDRKAQVYRNAKRVTRFTDESKQ